jgi:epoxyqueuosine reductase QueG
MDTSEELKNFLRAAGADFTGFADLTGIPVELRDNLPSGVSIGVALQPDIVSAITTGPTAEYFAEYRRANTLLDTLGRYCVRFLEKRGSRAIWSAATNAGIDSATLSTKLPHKTVATLAGLGWIGKCALLVTEKYGSAVRITTVLTDALLLCGVPVTVSGCGTCSACVDACPGKAPSGREWQPYILRDSFFDAFACRVTAGEFEKTRQGVSDSICGICIAACPWTRRYIERPR